MDRENVKRCDRCINRCRLDSPRCETGRKLAQSVDIFENEDNKEIGKVRAAMDILMWKLKK